MTELFRQSGDIPLPLAYIDPGIRNVLYALDGNSRLNFGELAGRANMSARQVRYRLDAVHERGVMAQCHAAVDTGLLGEIETRIFLSLTGEEPFSRLREFCLHFPQVKWLARLEGAYSAGITFRSSGLFSLGRFLHEVRIVLGDDVRTFSSNVVLWSRYLPRGYLAVGDVPWGNRGQSFGSAVSDQAPIMLDDIDRGIVKELERDGRCSFTAIAEALPLAGLSVSRETVARREAALRKRGVITGYTYVLNHATLGVIQHRLFLRCDARVAGAVVELAARHPRISKVMKLMGDWDFELNVDVPMGASISETVRELEATCRNWIFQTDYFCVKERVFL